jgi:hypothetical protein
MTQLTIVFTVPTDMTQRPNGVACKYSAPTLNKIDYKVGKTGAGIDASSKILGR